MTIKFNRQISQWGGSLVIPIPKELREYLGIKKDEEITLQPETGKHGKYISLWKK